MILYAQTQLETFTKSNDINTELNNLFKGEHIRIYMIWIYILIIITLILSIYMLLLSPLLGTADTYSPEFINQFLKVLMIIVLILTIIHTFILYISFDGKIENTQTIITNIISKLKEQINEYKEKNTIVAENQLLPSQKKDSIINLETFNDFLSQKNILINRINSSIGLANQYILNRQMEIDASGINLSSIVDIINYLYEQLTTTDNSLTISENNITTYLNDLNVIIKNSFDSQKSLILDKKNQINTLYTSNNYIGGISKSYINNNINNILDSTRRFLNFKNIMHQNSLTVIGMPYMIDNTNVLDAIGYVVRESNTDTFSDLKLHHNDKIYLSHKKIIENQNLFSNNDDTNMILKQLLIVPSVDELIYENNQLVIDNTNLASFHGLEYKKLNNIFHMQRGKFKFKYNMMFDTLYLSYTSNDININPHKCIVFRRNDILDYPAKHINYNLNEIEEYNYDSNTDKLYLKSKSIPHEFDSYIWNLFSTNLDANTRITYAKIPTGNNIQCNFMTIANNAIGLTFDINRDSHILFIEDNLEYFVIILNQYFTRFYKLTINGLVNYNPNSHFNLFTLPTKFINNNVLINSPNAVEHQTRIFDAFVQASTKQNINPTSPSLIYITNNTNIQVHD